MNEKLNFVLGKIQECGFSVEQETESVYWISRFTPKFQDCGASIDTEGDAENFISNIREYAWLFDVSYETYIWLDDTGHGRNGAPYDMIDVYNDMLWWRNSLEELSDFLVEALNEYES